MNSLHSPAPDSSSSLASWHAVMHWMHTEAHLWSHRCRLELQGRHNAHLRTRPKQGGRWGWLRRHKGLWDLSTSLSARCTRSSSQHKQWAGLVQRHTAARTVHVVLLAGHGSHKVLTLRTAARSDVWGVKWKLYLATAPSLLQNPAPSGQQQLCHTGSD